MVIIQEICQLIFMRSLTGFGSGFTLAGPNYITPEFTTYQKGNYAIGLVKDRFPAYADFKSTEISSPKKSIANLLKFN